MARRLTDDERETVRSFVESLYEQWAQITLDVDSEAKISYAEFARQAGVSYGSLSVWRAPATAKKRATPEAPDLLKLLRAARVIGPLYEIAQHGDVTATAVAAEDPREAEAEIRRLHEAGRRRAPARKRSSG